MREYSNKSFGLRKRNGKKRQAKALSCCCEMACNGQYAQGISYLSGGKELREQLHLPGTLAPEARKILCEANDIVIF